MDYEASLNDALARIDRGDLTGAKLTLEYLAKNKYRFSPYIQANILAAIALWHKAYGNYKKGLEFAKNAIILLKKCGLGEQAKASIYTLVGCLQRELGNTTEAEAYFMEVLKYRETLLGSHHPDLMVPLSNMGGIALDKGQYEASIQYYERAAAIVISQQGENSDDLAVIQLNLGEVYRITGQFEKASQLFLKAYQQLVKKHGPQSHSVIPALNNIASLCIELQQDKNSIHFLTQAIQILEEMRQQTHPLLGTLYHNLACAYRNLEDYETAEQLFHKTLTIRLNRLGGSHPLIAVTLNNLGWSYICNSKPDEAETVLAKAKQLLINHYGPDHIELCPVLNNLGQLAMVRQQYEQAKDWFEQCIQIALSQNEQHQTNLTIYHYNLEEACQKLLVGTAEKPIEQDKMEEAI